MAELVVVWTHRIRVVARADLVVNPDGPVPFVVEVLVATVVDVPFDTVVS